MNYACVPPCKLCRDAGSCETQEKIDYKKEHRRPPRWPDALTHTRMECGCRCEIMPIVRGIRLATHVWCETHGWQILTRPQEEIEKEQSKQEVIPF